MLWGPKKLTPRSTQVGDRCANQGYSQKGDESQP
jgi:hypothetical protein